MKLLDNSRFYILTGSILLSVIIFSLLRLQIVDDQLFYIRLQQLFGLVAVLYWYIALTISPLGYIIGKHRTKKLEFARRGIGVSAFYFALLHAVVAFWGQLGGFGGLATLPGLFQWSLLGGVIALTVLTIMALTSFDKVVSFMTFRWWKWLHRLVYVGGILAVLHIWSIGTHLSYPGIQLAAFIALVVLTGMELFRVVKLANKTIRLKGVEAGTLFFALWIIVSIGLFMIPSVVTNFHSRHLDSDGSHGHVEATE